MCYQHLINRRLIVNIPNLYNDFITLTATFAAQLYLVVADESYLALRRALVHRLTPGHITVCLCIQLTQINISQVIHHTAFTSLLTQGHHESLWQPRQVVQENQHAPLWVPVSKDEDPIYTYLFMYSLSGLNKCSLSLYLFFPLEMLSVWLHGSRFWGGVGRGREGCAFSCALQ